MTNYLKTAAAVGALAFAATQANAAPIQGTINFAGVNDIELTGGSTFPSATGIHFTGGTPNAIVTSTAAVGGTDSFGANGVGFLQAATFKDFTFGAAVPSLWTLTTGGGVTFTFNLASASNLSPDNSFLNIKGNGTVTSSVAGLDPTTGFFSLTSSRSSDGQTDFSWQSTTSSAPPPGAPDGGATVMLLGIGVAGLGLASKLRR